MCDKIDTVGVDLNRNYDFAFGFDELGSNSNPCEDDYRGKAPFSEPATRQMKNFLEKFDIESSVFLEDRPLDLAKPNPESLIESISKINSKCSLYIGDSMEDLLMVQKCQEQGYDVSFCGIYGSSDEPELKYELFQKILQKE